MSILLETAKLIRPLIDPDYVGFLKGKPHILFTESDFILFLYKFKHEATEKLAYKYKIKDTPFWKTFEEDVESFMLDDNPDMFIVSTVSKCGEWLEKYHNKEFHSSSDFKHIPKKNLYD